LFVLVDWNLYVPGCLYSQSKSDTFVGGP